jgi:hypothetical protein
MKTTGSPAGKTIGTTIRNSTGKITECAMGKAARARTLLLVTTIAAAVLAGAPRTARGNPHADPPRIQLAILLDTSNSMDGLIHQARAQLWKIINEFATAERDGRQPVLEVALFEYGNDGLAAEGGHIRMVLPLTTDLDAVSEELFALTTNGGSEYCGWVIQEAVERLAWSNSADDLKVLFIAGNEPFTQGEVDYRRSCRAAIARNITVNTIHCGSPADGMSGGWNDGALLADGRYMNIDQNQALVHIDAPQDAEIALLGSELIQTYMPSGVPGRAGAARQRAQDAQARGVAPEVSSQRTLFKSSVNYKNAAWDLVDAVKEGEVDLDRLEPSALPEDLRAMTPEERKAHVASNQQKRAEIQERISRLRVERDRYVAAKQGEVGESQADALDAAMIEALREQAARKSFVLE